MSINGPIVYLPESMHHNLSNGENFTVKACRSSENELFSKRVFFPGFRVRRGFATTGFWLKPGRLQTQNREKSSDKHFSKKFTIRNVMM